MTRLAEAKQAVTATGKARMAASALVREAPAKFLAFEEHGGVYQWMIVARSGETLVRFASHAIYDEAKQAARIARAGADSASPKHLGGRCERLVWPRRSPQNCGDASRSRHRVLAG